VQISPVGKCQEPRRNKEASRAELRYMLLK
jgi:hypothetical protein